MPRRALNRTAIHSLIASQPWTLHDDDPGAGGGGGTGTGGTGQGGIGGGPQVGAHGFPEATPVAEMSAEHQAAYWKYQSRKHEQRAAAAPDAAELERLRAAEAELATRKNAEMTEAQRVQAEKDTAVAAAATAQAAAETAARRALLLEVAMAKGLSVEQAERLRGTTKEELETDADTLKSLFPGQAPAGQVRVGGPQGGDVKPATTIQAGAELYRAQHPKRS